MKKFNSHRENGQGLLEYALIAALVAVATMLVLSLLGVSVADVFCRVTGGLGANALCQGCGYGFDNIDDWNTVQGGWETRDGQLCNTRGGQGKIFDSCSQDLPSNDYTVTANSVTLSQGNGYGIFFRNSGGARDNGYIFQYDPGYGGGAFIFRKRINGRETRAFAVNRPSGFDWNASHDVQVKVEGDTFTAYVDGVEVLTATDDTFTEGGTGIRTWDNTRTCFDELTVEPSFR